MDSKVTKLAVLTVLSLMALVLVLVYVTNADRINKLFNKDAMAEASASGSASSVATSYGVQIGDNLKGFIAESDFFDSVEQLDQIISEDVEAVEIKAEASDGSITVRIYNTRGGLETGALFKADIQRIGKATSGTASSGKTASGTASAKEDVKPDKPEEDAKSDKPEEDASEQDKNTTKVDSTYIDADMDGIILADELKPGTYEVSIEEIKGYHVPQVSERVIVMESKKEETSTAVADKSIEE